MGKYMLGIWIGLLGMSGAGCQSTPSIANPASIEADQYETVYHAAIATLRDHGFHVDRQDYRFGRITTRPLDSPTLFEPWRGHNSTSNQTFASTAGHLQRRVNILLDIATEQADEAEAYTVQVEVLLERRQLPLRRLTGTASRQRIDSLRAVPTQWQERGITAEYDLAIGRDAEYEQRLLHEILQRAAAHDF